MRVDRIGWDDLNAHKTAEKRRREQREAADARRLWKHFWADQHNQPTWFYRKDTREW